MWLGLFKEMNKYEVRVCLMLAVSGLLNTFPSMMPLVTNYEPDYSCDYSKVFNENDTASEVLRNGTIDYEWLADYLTPDKVDLQGNRKNDVCKFYKMETQEILEAWNSFNSGNEAKAIDASREVQNCDHIKFSISDGASSVVTEFNLVCENAWAKKLVPTMLMLGMATGCFSGGFLSDRFGRKLIFLLFTALQVLFTATIGLSTGPVMYLAMMYFNGISTLVNYAAAAVLGYELVREKFRNLFYFCLNITFSLGCVLFPVCSYFIRDWRWFSISTLLLGMPQVLYYWYVDESPKWLLATGQKEKAEAVLRKIAVINGEEFDEADLTREEKEVESDKKSQQSVPVLVMWKQLLQTPVTVYFLFACMFAWCIANMVYYPALLGSNTLSGNRFMNAGLSGAVECVAIVASFSFLELFDRRKSYTAVGILTMVAVEVRPLLAPVSATGETVAALFIRMGAATIFYILYIQTPEVFPTTMRQSAFMVCSGFSRVFNTTLPYFMYSDKPLLSASIGSGLILASVVCFMFLPNTFNRKLPDTIEDCLQLERFQFCGKNKPSEEKSRTYAHAQGASVTEKQLLEPLNNTV